MSQYPSGTASAPSGAEAVSPWMAKTSPWGRTEPVEVRRAAVLIVARNEEPVIAATLGSVLASYEAHDVFLFDDASTDATATIAQGYLPAANVFEHATNVGKSRGLEAALTQHIYPAGYEYVTIVDADTTLEPDYRNHVMRTFEEDPAVICAAGQVKSRPYGTNVISIYRACLYFLWQGLFKRLQSAVNAIAIAPGCASTWRTSALRRIEFDHRMSTEDFNLSIAAHRLGLGRIKYVHEAVVWTQDPLTLRAFVRQIQRWSRAWWEAVRFHKLGLLWVRRNAEGHWRLSGLDIVNAALVVTLEVFFIRLLALPVFILTPLEAWPDVLFPDTTAGLVLDLIVQAVVVMGAVMVAAAATGRLLMVPLAPVIAALMVVEYVISTIALVSVMRRLYRVPRSSRGQVSAAAAWESPERRQVRASAPQYRRESRSGVTE
jgi:cellulose synthase/poly-beta-1,6-N-acetylglucosamine synthase-like glycosyltransferase